ASSLWSAIRQRVPEKIVPVASYGESQDEAPRSKLRGITELNSEDFSEGEANPVASYGECQVHMNKLFIGIDNRHRDSRVLEETAESFFSWDSLGWKPAGPSAQSRQHETKGCKGRYVENRHGNGP